MPILDLILLVTVTLKSKNNKEKLTCFTHNEWLLPSIMINWHDTINDLTETSTVTVTTHIRRQRAAHWKLHCTGTVSATVGTLTRIFYICKPSRLPVGGREGGGRARKLRNETPASTFLSFPRRTRRVRRAVPARRYPPVARKPGIAGYMLQWDYLVLLHVVAFRCLSR